MRLKSLRCGNSKLVLIAMYASNGGNCGSVVGVAKVYTECQHSSFCKKVLNWQEINAEHNQRG